MKLSIVATGKHWERALQDKRDGYRMWCVSSVFERLQGIGVEPDLIFQVHAPSVFEHWVAKEHLRVVTMRGVLGTKQLPWERLLTKFGRKFGSSLAWMLALAIDQGYTDIRIHGVHLSIPAYIDQRDTFFWFWGYCESRGIKVSIDKDSGVWLDQAYQL